MWKVEPVREGPSETKAAFDQLTACLELSLVAEWTTQEQIAMETCGDALRVYEVTSEKCKRCIALLLLYFSCDLALPHFSKFCDQIFKLQLLTHFFMYFLKT